MFVAGSARLRSAIAAAVPLLFPTLAARLGARLDPLCSRAGGLGWDVVRDRSRRAGGRATRDRRARIELTHFAVGDPPLEQREPLGEDVFWSASCEITVE